MHRKRKTKKEEDEAMGFGEWGGYFDAKKAKLIDQFNQVSEKVEQKSDIFKGVAIFINGHTRPNSTELRKIMAENGGIFHGYQMSNTTHIIASNLPNVKIKQLGSVPIVKPSWISDSLEFNKLLDYKRYLLYTNQSSTQPRLEFPVIEKNASVVNASNSIANSVNNEASARKDNNFEVKDKISDLIQDKSLLNATKSVPSKEISVNNDAKYKNSDFGHAKTASDPSFIEDFYNNSRLHLIATLGAEFKQYIVQLRNKSKGVFPGREKIIQTIGKPSKAIAGSIIMHIDMDCFFVSVALRTRPDLIGKPVAITHAKNGQLSHSMPGRERDTEIAMYLERHPDGLSRENSRLGGIDSQASMSEIASCSYEARKFGIKNGMFLGAAVKLCPEIIPVPYDFQGYKDVSFTLYNTLAEYTLDIEAVSCDEMYVDITSILKTTGLTIEEWATHIRNEIKERTGCPCSTGFGSNRLQARLATKKAKPNGQFYLESDDVESYFAEIQLLEIPGVGRATLNKLRSLGLETCGDVQNTPLSILQNELGPKMGETLLEQAKGIDKKPLNYYHERKSVSAEVNYGIRFKNIEECYTFLQGLSTEVSNRLVETGLQAKCITLKLMIRAHDAPVETAKFLGHGICDSINKSTTLNSSITDSGTIYKEIKSIYDKLKVPFIDLRGIGIQLSKLEKAGPSNNFLSNFLKQPSKKSTKENTSVENQSENLISSNNSIKIEARVVTQNNDKSLSRSKSPTKRGRPKGSTNKPKTQKTVQKNNLFKTAPPKPKIILNEEALNKHGIDVNVFNELPDFLKEEVLAQYNLQTENVANEVVSLPKEKTAQELERIVPEKEAKSLQEKPQKSPFENLNWSQLKPIITNWVTSEEKPNDFDTKMIGEHFKNLALDRKIENLQVIFNFLHRYLQNFPCHWHKAYFFIVNVMQEGMVSRYGNTLFVQRKFSCCSM